MIQLLCCITMILSTHLLSPVEWSAHHTWQAPEELVITVPFELKKSEALLKNSIHISVDTPALEIVTWESTQPASTVYNTGRTHEFLAYASNGAFVITLKPTSTTQLPDEAHVVIQYQEKSTETPQEFRYVFSPKEQTPKTSTTTSPSTVTSPRTKKTGAQEQSSWLAWFSQHLEKFSAFISGLVEKTNSPFLRIITIFLLGLLMSLTPCIYPMIPITVGILQTTSQKSLFTNFLLAASYTLGIAMTFACLGLLAAFGGAHFGSVMGNVYFVLFLVAFLCYLAFSMLGFYDMYVPRFMQSNGNHTVNGSYVSAFIFGAISGSAASPCLSPGLGFMFALVADLGSKLLGFLYLFIFGLGLGTPLLIIGTFSNAANVVPRAGLWMVEVKKLFGFMLLSMCFYYLAAVMPWHLWLWLLAISLCAAGVWYVATIESYYSTGMRWYKQIVGFLFLVAACLTAYQAIKATFYKNHAQDEFHHQTHYEQAREQALQEHKHLILDFSTAWCTSCKAIERKFLQNKGVNNELRDFIIVKIDCSNDKNEDCLRTQERFASQIRGFPTLLVVDPQTQNVLAHWGSEILNLSPEEFIDLAHGALAQK